MTRSAKWLVAVLVAITAASIGALVFVVAGRAGVGEHDENDEAEVVKTQSRVSVRNGRAVITIDAAAQAREGIRIVPVAAASRRAELRATAVLLGAADLATARNGYVAARTKVARDEVDLDISRREYERVKALYAQDQNVSLKTTQGAEAAFRHVQAQADADRQDADLQLDVVRQRWGRTIGDWIAAANASFQAVLDQRAVLAQVVFPPGSVAAPPATLAVDTPAGTPVEARYISAFPQVDARIQGISFLYLLPARPGLAAGMNLAVTVPFGEPVAGSVVPDGAVVWWEGKAWVYEALSSTTFARRAIVADSPVAGGYFVGALAPGTRLVTVGAQALLSEEFRSQIQQES